MSQEQRFAELLSRVAREVTVRQATEVCCGDLTLEQFQTLRTINSSGPSSIGALAAAFQVDLSTMSRNVALLERKDYLEKGRSAEDGRVVHVQLTAKGERALHTLRCGERDVLGDVFDRLPTRDRSNVLDALESLGACLLPGSASSTCCAPSPSIAAIRTIKATSGKKA